MAEDLVLNRKKSIILKPKAPYNFNANFHKPSHFPSSDNIWEEDKHRTTMLWNGKSLGLKFENKGTVQKPEIKLTVYSQKALPWGYLDALLPEITWRFNFDQDISYFCRTFAKDTKIGAAIKKWEGMKPIAANSLYEALVIYLVLQNATVRRSVQMLENLFSRFGKKLTFDNVTLSAFWPPTAIAHSSEDELRALKVGYRAKFLLRISEQFENRTIDEFALRSKQKEEVKKEVLKLYGIGKASAEYLLFGDFYFLDALETIPPWEQKIMSRLLFSRKLVPAGKILNFFKSGYRSYEKLAFHYIWEDVFWQRKQKRIEWLEKEIRL